MVLASKYEGKYQFSILTLRRVKENKINETNLITFRKSFLISAVQLDFVTSKTRYDLLFVIAEGLLFDWVFGEGTRAS